MPLVEIVSEPDMRTSEQAKEYATELRAILLATGVSDAKMEEGSMRVDANVSVHRTGEPWGTRCEIKNLNSLRSLGRAIDHEALRQIDLLDGGERVRQETRHWDEAAGRTGTLRVEGGRRRLPVLPRARPRAARSEPPRTSPASTPPCPCSPPPAARALGCRRRASTTTGGAVAIAVERGPRRAGRWPPSPPAPTPAGCSPTSSTTSPSTARRRCRRSTWPRSCDMETGGELTATQAKTVLAEVVASGQSPAEVAKAHGFEALDTGALEAFVDAVIAANPERVGAAGRR